jgi:hypothetical protein
MKYTDIDYYVFTDAARFTARGYSPYDRETYRYTPLLAWMLLPTTWSSTWFSFGKVLFAIGDMIAGWLIVLVLQSSNKMPLERALKFACIWLLNPMVATISTRGSSEGLLGVMVIALLWAIMQRRIALAGMLLGLGVHFKIYPFIYSPSIIWWLDDEHIGSAKPSSKNQSTDILNLAKRFCNGPRIKLTLTSLLTFMALNTLMYSRSVMFSPLFTHFPNFISSFPSSNSPLTRLHEFYTSSPRIEPSSLSKPFSLTNNHKKLRLPLPPTHLPPPRHEDRPPPQLQSLQYPSLPLLRPRYLIHALGIPRFPSPTLPLSLRPPSHAS